MAEDAGAPTVEFHSFAGDGLVPNNPELPLVLYHDALVGGPDAAARCTARFAENGWVGGWRGGIYAHHHYHSTAHEVLGVVGGSARVRLGGDHGASVELRSGDVVVIPAGVAHKCEAASPDLVVIGAYPQGQRPDMRGPSARDCAAAQAAIAAVPLPGSDPLYGRTGPLLDRWRGGAAG